MSDQMKKDIALVLSRHFTYSVEEMEDALNLLKSVDNTILATHLAMAHNQPLISSCLNIKNLLNTQGLFYS